MSQPRFTLTPKELVAFHECLSSKLCLRIFRILLTNHVLNISAIARKARCNNRDALKHLKNLARLGIVQEEFYAELHTFTLKRVEFTRLMEQAIKSMEKNAR